MKEVISFNSFRYSCHVYIDVVFCCKSYGVSYNIFTWNYYHHNSIEKAAASRFYFNDYDQSYPMNILSMVMDFFFYKVYTVGTSFPSSSPVRGGGVVIMVQMIPCFSLMVSERPQKTVNRCQSRCCIIKTHICQS